MLEWELAVDEIKIDDAYLNFLQNTTRSKKFVNIANKRYLEDKRDYSCTTDKCAYQYKGSHPIF